MVGDKIQQGEMMHDVMEDLLGDGIFNVDVTKWQHQRKVTSHESLPENANLPCA